MGGDGKGHPLPESDEARHDEIPEGIEREKGLGDDGEQAIQPRGPAVNPDGEPYDEGGPEHEADPKAL
jgi:hypothetical protein